MERAAAGEELFITRRGKPYVRLLPASDQPALERETGSSGPRMP